MRDISSGQVTQLVARLCKQAAYELGEDVVAALESARASEESDVGKEVLGMLLRNAEIARQGVFPLCQDTGLVVVFCDLGQDAHISGGDLGAAIEEGVRQGYREAYLRKSVVRHPFSDRDNTGDNTPVVTHVRIVPGDSCKLTVVPKGGGSENMSYLRVLPPAVGRQGVVDFVVQCVSESGARPCPPVIVGVGVGGTVEKTMLIAKESLLRKVGHHNPDPEIADLERELFQRINGLGIGPQGFGGSATALAVNVETFPCHIASLPVAVNLQCHSARHKEGTL